MISLYIEFLTTFTLIMAYLLTNNRLLIGIIFAFVILTFGIEAGGNPLVIIPKVLLGRSETKHLRNMLIAQNLGMFSALAIYYIAVKQKWITKHPLDKIK